MHTLWLFFSWPGGFIWGNVGAMPVCGLIAAVFAFVCRDRLGRALSGFWHRHFGHRAELDAIRKQLGAHADALDLGTPGGLAAVMAEIRETRTAAESALAGVQALAAVAAKPAARRGATEMRRTGTGKAGGS